MTSDPARELGGPEVYTFKELMQFVLATIDRRRLCRRSRSGRRS